MSNNFWCVSKRLDNVQRPKNVGVYSPKASILGVYINFATIVFDLDLLRWYEHLISLSTGLGSPLFNIDRFSKGIESLSNQPPIRKVIVHEPLKLCIIFRRPM